MYGIFTNTGPKKTHVGKYVGTLSLSVLELLEGRNCGFTDLCFGSKGPLAAALSAHLGSSFTRAPGGQDGHPLQDRDGMGRSYPLLNQHN